MKSLWEVFLLTLLARQRGCRSPLARKRPARGHSLLEALIATGIFIMVAVALSGIWVMYGKSLAKSGEVIAANNLARSVSDGLVANGWDFLKTQEGLSPLPESNYVIERRVRGKQADIKYNVVHEAVFNTGTVGPVLSRSFFSEDLCQLTVTVRWNSAAGGGGTSSPNYNNQVTYTTIVYKKGMVRP